MMKYVEVITALNNLEFDSCDCCRDTIEEAIRAIKAARNTICFNCENYEHAHEGACDGCRWKD